MKGSEKTYIIRETITSVSSGRTSHCDFIGTFDKLASKFKLTSEADMRRAGFSSSQAKKYPKTIKGLVSALNKSCLWYESYTQIDESQLGDNVWTL